MDHPAQLTDRYQIEEQIGRGAMGRVFRAIHRATAEPVAIKALRLELAPEAEQVERFLREGEALRRLSHPNIVKCRETFEAPDHFYMVLDYIEGGSVRRVLREAGALPLSQALDVMLDVCDALTRAHRLQIVHRDVKPDNILLDGEGQAHLTDFGLAYLGSSWSSLTQDGTALGTLAYMSPEACRAEPASPAQDIWACAVSLYEMLSGRLPFGESSPGHTILTIMGHPPAPLNCPHLPAEVESLLQRMLCKAPEDRISSMREVALELERLRQGSGPLRSLSLPAPPSLSGPEKESMPGYLVQLESGEILWEQDSPSDFVAYLEEGQLEVVGTNSEGSAMVFTRIQPGEMLGEMSCLDGKEHSATVRAHGPACIRRLGKFEFLNWIRTDPERMQSILLKQSERLRRVADRLMHSQEPLGKRIAFRLLESEGGELCLPRRLLAQELVVEAESLQAELQHLEEAGLVRLTSDTVEVVDWLGLRELRF